MTIEFQCDGCLKTLRTADEKAGRIARCPQCGKELTVPEAPRSDFDEFAAVPPPRSSHLSDFEDLTKAPPRPRPKPAEITCPMCGEVNANTTDRCLACGEPLDRFPAGAPGGLSTRFPDVWARAWEVWSANLGINIAAIAVAGLVLLCSYMIWIGMVCAGFGVGMGFGAGGGPPAIGGVFMIVAMAIAYLQILVVIWLLQVGLSRFGIDNERRENPNLGVMFDFSGRILPSIVGMLAYAMALMIILSPALVVMIVGVVQMEVNPDEPLGMVLYLGGALSQAVMNGVATMLLWPIPYMLADRRKNLYSSLIDGPRLAISNMQLSVLLGLVQVALWFVGSMACGIGLLFTMSLGFVLFAVAYERCRLTTSLADASSSLGGDTP